MDALRGVLALPVGAARSPGRALLWSLLLPALAPAQTSLLRQSEVDVMQGYPIARVAAGDFDGDGLSDLAGISFEAFPGPHTQDKVLIQLQVAGSPPSFRDAQSFPVSAPQDLLVADLDADGDPDLAVVQDDASDALAIWINQGGRQGGPPGQLNRLPLTLALDLAARVLAVDVDANPATPPSLLLVRGTGRDSLLLANHLHLPTPELTLQQAMAHPGAIGATMADIDGNGIPDLLIYGNGCRLWAHQGPGIVEPYALVSAPFCGTGPVHAAAMETMPGSGQYAVALAYTTGDFWVTATPAGFFTLPLGTSAIGITRDFAFVDADGDGDLDLLGARANEDAALPAQRGSPVYRRIGAGFEGTLQAVQSAWSARTFAHSPGANTTLLLAHPLRTTGLWQAQPASNLTPVVQFTTDYATFPEPHPVGYLEFQPFSTSPLTSVHVDAASDSGAPAGWSEDLGPGIRTVVADAPVSAPAPSRWLMTIADVSPPGAAAIGARRSMTVLVVPREPPEGQCWLEGLFLTMAQLTGDALEAVGGAGSAAQLEQLRRVRDERLAATTAGGYYIGLYAQLQPDLYAASIADSQFAIQLWALKDAWMPAIDNWLDGDGQALVSASMQQALSMALNRLGAHGSLRLNEAVARERRALGLDRLEGRPIADLQARWERSPLHDSGFE